MDGMMSLHNRCDYLLILAYGLTAPAEVLDLASSTTHELGVRMARWIA